MKKIFCIISLVFSVLLMADSTKNLSYEQVIEICDSSSDNQVELSFYSGSFFPIRLWNKGKLYLLAGMDNTRGGKDVMMIVPEKYKADIQNCLRSQKPYRAKFSIVGGYWNKKFPLLKMEEFLNFEKNEEK